MEQHETAMPEISARDADSHSKAIVHARQHQRLNCSQLQVEYCTTSLE